MIIEKNILGYLLLYPGSILKIKVPEFNNVAHEKIFKSICDLVKAYKCKVSIIDIKDHLRSAGQLDKIGGIGYLLELIDSCDFGLSENALATKTR